MSKQSSRRKRQQQHKKQQARLTGPVLTQYGINAFKQANYNEAIKLWEQARPKENIPANLLNAIAEAYFRRAVSDSASRLVDLQRAVQLKPDDSLYRYHLALAHHRLGQLDQAAPLYRRLLAASLPFKRAAAPLAQLLIEQKKTPAKDPVWDYLSQNDKNQLAAAEALVKKKAASTLRQLADTELEPVWRGLVAVALGDTTAAQESLQVALKSPGQRHALARGVMHYYLGTLAAATGQTDQAQEQWQAAWSNGLDTPYLRHNLSAQVYQKAVAEKQAGRLAAALDLVEQIGDPTMIGKKLSGLYRQLAWELGYAAYQKDNWGQALHYFEVAQSAGDDRKLILNLALAYQRLEDHYEAAEQWRTLLRRRPRKATHPDALSDEQVARIWQNVAENYAQAGDYEEAVKTYKNAVKWAPDNIDLRLRLVDAFQSEGRWQAAENELHRILRKDPDHVQAMIMLADMHIDSYFPNYARNLLLRVLELEPQNPIARQQLAHLFIKQGSFSAQWGNYKQAIKVYKEGLEYVPDSQKLHVAIGSAYADNGQFKQAHKAFEQALAINSSDLQTLHAIFMVWLEYDHEPYLGQMVKRLKTLSDTVPSNLFLDLIHRCFNVGQDDYAESLLKYVEKQYPDDEHAQVQVAMHYTEIDNEKRAVSILRKILKTNPNHAEANLRLGSVYYRLGQTRLAKRHWDKAEQLARAENNQMLLYDLKMAKDFLMHGKTPPQNPLEMLQQMPSDLKRQLLDQLPPEVADVLNMDPDTLEMMMGFGMGDLMDDFDDDFDDEDDFYYDF